MKIACLAWGSLLWKTDPLVLASPWHADGPRLPIEFGRVGDGGELSTALCEGVDLQPTWWALLAADDVAEARELLRQREQIDPARPDWVGSLPALTAATPRPCIQHWLDMQSLDAVVWTALPPRYEGQEGRMASAAQAVGYLQGLAGTTRAHAESYIRQVPAAMDTAVRRAVAARLGWTANDS